MKQYAGDNLKDTRREIALSEIAVEECGSCLPDYAR
jgi:hypothetical protein